MYKIKSTRADMIFDAANNSLLTMLLILTIYPLYFVLIASVSDPNLVNAGKVILIPKGLNIEGYKLILEDARIWKGYGNSFIYTFAGTFLNLAATLPCAYALSRKDLKGRGVLMGVFIFVMYFQGGIVPSYILIRQLNIMDTIWSLVLPKAVIVYYMIIARTFFASTIPDELLESARIDGAGNTRFFSSFVLPLSKALIAVLTLYYALVHWNSWFDANLYMKSQNKWPLQLVLRSILVTTDYSNEAIVDIAEVELQEKLKSLVQFGVIIAASVPVLLLYPFIQRYFIKGVMIGSVKG